MHEPKPEQWAYLAGLFAGEGCFAVRAKEDVPIFELRIQMYDQEVLNQVAAVFGGKLSTGSKRGTGQRLRDAGLWNLSDGYAIQRMLPQLLEYMVGEKREQGELFKRFVDRKLMIYEQRQQERRSKYSDIERLELYQLAVVCREMAGGGSKGWKQQWKKRIAELSAS